MNPLAISQSSPLEVQAFHVWCGASSGRRYARSDDPDTRLRAYTRLHNLKQIHSDKFPTLTRVAQGAARDIDRLLKFHERNEV